MLEIIETPVFTKLVQELLPPEQYRLLQWALVARPDQGTLVPHASGLRKLRWVIPGQGKRGGLRVLYFWDKPNRQIYMLYLYSKRDQADLTPTQAKALGRLIREELK
ncbi:MAG: type II toxin-antitoxin system RelE/ParE family toxin [Candidatus Hydrogenedentes bacterium]|nr:type II toxin-antitoxin system RelE/ParE family toxin [Candidatus Hydrogenedentota bacterium]